MQRTSCWWYQRSVFCYSFSPYMLLPWWLWVSVIFIEAPIWTATNSSMLEYKNTNEKKNNNNLVILDSVVKILQYYTYFATRYVKRMVIWYIYMKKAIRYTHYPALWQPWYLNSWKEGSTPYRKDYFFSNATGISYCCNICAGRSVMSHPSICICT